MDRFSNFDSPEKQKNVKEENNQHLNKESQKSDEPNLSVADDLEISNELGAEAPLYSYMRRANQPERDEIEEGNIVNGLGMIGIIISVLSFFFFPFLLAPIGIILGILSVRNDHQIGWYAVGIGAAALLLTVLILPMAFGR